MAQVALTAEEEARAAEVFYRQSLNTPAVVQAVLAGLGQSVLRDEVDCLLGMAGVLPGHYLQLADFVAILGILKKRR